MDKRNNIPCRFFFEKGGCKKENCEYSHDHAVYHSRGGSASQGGHPSENRGRGGFGGGFGGGRGGRPYGSGSDFKGSKEFDDSSRGGGPPSNRRGRGRGGRFGTGPRNFEPYEKKPKPMEQGPNLNKTNKGGICKFFRQGTCQDGASCKFQHFWTNQDDLKLIYLNSFGEERPKTNDFEIRDVCIIDIPMKKLVFAQPRMIIVADLTNPNKEFQSKPMADWEEITCMKYFEGSLVLGVYDDKLKCSVIKIIRGDSSEIVISPAHLDYIVDICNINVFIVTASLDCKIKFWKWNEIANNFEVALTHNHKEMSRMLYLPHNGLDALILANADNSLTFFSLNYGNPPNISLNIDANFDNYHADAITNMKAIKIANETHILTSSLDQTIKFFSMVKGSAVHQQGFQLPISSMEIVTNSKDKEILVLGCANGNVELYELSQNFLEVGKLIIHKSSLISSIIGFSEKKNDVSFNYMLAADTWGRVTAWMFQKERKL